MPNLLLQFITCITKNHKGKELGASLQLNWF